MSEEKSSSVDGKVKALPDGSAISCFACGAKTDLSGKIPGDKIKCADCSVEITVPEPDIIKKLAGFESFNEIPKKKPVEENITHKIFCYSCKGKIDVSDQVVGSHFDCPGCGTNLKVPERDQDQTSEEDTATNHEPLGKLKINCHTCGAKLDVTGEQPFRKVNCPACNAEFQIPKRFGHFLLEQRLGETDNFAVYRALDLTLSREVCLKVMSPKLSDKKELLNSFLAEAGKTALINDPNVVPIYSSGEHDGCSYLVMQFMSALSLKPYLEKAKGILPISSVLRVIKEAAKGLAAAHSQGISHHNVSLNNILLDRDGNIKVADFTFDYTLYKLSEGKENLLKFFDPQYISIEMVESGENDLRGDIYSLGAVFYHLLTGVPPFPGTNPESIMKERLERSPVEAKKVRNEIPDYISGYISKMMSNDPQDRPQSWSSVIEILESFISGKPKFTVPVSKVPSEDEIKIASNDYMESNSDVETVVSDLQSSQHLPVDVAGTGQEGSPKSVPPMVYAIFAAIIFVCGVILYIPGEPVEADNEQDNQTSVRVSKIESLKDNQEDKTKNENIPDEVNLEANKISSDDNPAPGSEVATQNVPNGGGFPVKVSERPLPHGISFKAYAEEIMAYLDKHEGDSYNQEMHRIKCLRNIKPYIERITLLLPYKGQLYVRGRNPIEGTIVSASVRSLTIKPDTADQTLELSWQQFENRQFFEMLEYYIKIRSEQLSDSSIAEAAIIKRDLGADYFRLALLSDWYRMTDLVETYRNLTLEYDPMLEKQVVALIPSVDE